MQGLLSLTVNCSLRHAFLFIALSLLLFSFWLHTILVARPVTFYSRRLLKLFSSCYFHCLLPLSIPPLITKSTVGF